jgi:hypothetical protein
MKIARFVGVLTATLLLAPVLCHAQQVAWDSPTPYAPDASATAPMVRPTAVRAPVSGMPIFEHTAGAHESDCGGPECGACESGGCWWEHRCGVFGEWLFLHAGNFDVPYAMPVDGTASSAVPTGPLGVARPDYDSGFRVGVNWACDETSSLRATFSFFESESSDSIVAPSGDVIRALLTHPTTLNAAADSLFASAEYDIDFDLIDLEYRQLLYGDDRHALNGVLGVRYGHLQQDLRATYAILGTTIVDSHVNFDGIGPRFGLDGERRFHHGFLVYGRTFANFLIGDFNAEYRQSNVFAGTQARTSFDDDRIVPVLEAELGVGWGTKSGCFRVLAGYLVSGWFNSLSTGTFIDGVQTSQLNELDETLTFDGLTVRAELNF